MSLTTAIIIDLLLCIACAIVVLRLDAKRRRMDRQIANALPTSAVAHGLPSLRRQQTQSRWQSIHRLFQYDPGTVYLVRTEIVFVVGFIVANVISYVGNLLEFPIQYGIVAGISAAIVVIRGLFGWQQARFRNLLFKQIPDVIELVTSTIRAGLPITEAFQIIAKDMPEPTAGQFAIVCNEMSLGGPPEEALEGIYQRSHVAEYAMFAVTLAVQMKSGGSLAETLQTLGETVRQRVGLAGRAKALAGEVIFSARALSAAPFLVSGLFYWINPRSIDMLFFDPTGRMLLGYGVTSVIIGTFVIRWMIRRETTI